MQALALLVVRVVRYFSGVQDGAWAAARMHWGDSGDGGCGCSSWCGYGGRSSPRCRSRTRCCCCCSRTPPPRCSRQTRWGGGKCSRSWTFCGSGPRCRWFPPSTEPLAGRPEAPQKPGGPARDWQPLLRGFGLEYECRSPPLAAFGATWKKSGSLDQLLELWRKQQVQINKEEL